MDKSPLTAAQLLTLVTALLRPAPSPTKRILEALKASGKWFTKPTS